MIYIVTCIVLSIICIGELRMKKNTKINRKLTVGIILLFIGMALSASTSQSADQQDNFQDKIKFVTVVQTFSSPILKEEGQYSTIYVEEANSLPMEPLNPMMPVLIKTYEFPLGTKIMDVQVTTSEIKTLEITKTIKPFPMPQASTTSQKISLHETFNQEIYDSNDPYPSQWVDMRKGAGLNKNDQRVLFCSMKLYPVQYLPADHILEYIDQIEVTVTYEEPVEEPTCLDSTCDLAIITPRKFASSLKRLVAHKNKYDMKTQLFTLETDIIGKYDGRDDAEQIKYFIKHAIEEWDVHYVLLVGDIQKLPIRTTYPWEEYYEDEEDVLSDLYYADIYDSSHQFCSWDSNGNDKFGELYYDEVDLYPDVHLGRLPCSFRWEAAIMINKIITYEKQTSGKSWFNNLLLLGGDTHVGPFSPGNEGEITNDIVAGFMPEFNPIRLWTSLGKFNAEEINNEINKGVGFIDYSGHGFEIGLGTHPPLDETWIFYYLNNLFSLLNRNKLPIIFFGACLTARLDYTVGEFRQILPPNIRQIFDILPLDDSDVFPCFAWYFVKKFMGGAVASVGATRVAYSYVDEDFWFGCSALAIYFFKSYSEGINVGQMLTQAQNDYIEEIWPDYFTLEEFVLIGDPSLKVGGYP